MIDPAQARRYFESRLTTDRQRLNGKAAVTVRCPFHDDRNASLSLNLDKGIWCCHAGCGDGGILDFEQKISGCDRDTARTNVDTLLGERVFATSPGRQQPLAIYRYTDARGKLLFEKLRYEPKAFSYRHEDEHGRWVWNLQDVKKAPYRLHELIEAAHVIYTEGEKDADNVRAAFQTVDLSGQRIAATTAGSTGDWRNDYAKYFAGREVIILPDNDEPGRLHAEQVAAAIHPVAAGVKIVALPGLPEKGDVSNYLESHSGDELLAEIRKHKECWSGTKNEWHSLFHSYQEIMNAPPTHFAIEGFLQEEGVTLIGGLAGHGKTLCMLAMTRALLEGGKLFHHFPVNQTAERVIYLIPESALGPFSARLKTFHLEEYVRDGRLFCRTLSAPGSLALTDPRLLEAVQGADVFLDTAIRFMVGEENSATEQKLFAETLFNLQRAGARTITGAHHSPKSFGKDSFMTLENVLRGSGDIGAMVVTCWGLAQIDPDKNRIFVQNVKPRDFMPCPPFIIQGRPSINESGYFELTDPPGFAGELADHKSADKKPGRPSEKNEKFAKAIELKQQGMSYSEIAQQLGLPKSTVSGWFKKDEEIQ